MAPRRKLKKNDVKAAVVSLSTVARETGREKVTAPLPSSSQASNIGFELDDGGDGEEQSTICLGFVKVNIVGLQYYDGTVSDGEMVGLVREPHNPYDSNAIKVVNIRGDQVGHIERYKACHLAPLVDNGLAKLEGVVYRGSSNVHKMPCSVSVYSLPEEHTMDMVRSRLQIGGMPLTTEQDASSDPSLQNTLSKQKNATEQELEDDLMTMFESLHEGMGKGQKMDPGDSIKSTLFEHQKEALAWLVSRENSLRLPPFWEMKRGKTSTSQIMYTNVLTNYSTVKRPVPFRGGIFADDMGLGKTLCLLSLIATNRPGAILPKITETEKDEQPTKRQKTETKVKSKTKAAPSLVEKEREETPLQPPPEGGPKATLVVCPLSVLSNWTNQIKEHVKQADILVYVYHGSERIKDTDFLSQMDVVLTTYNVLSSEGPEPKDSSPLQKINWLRIILDEGHTIKSSLTKTTKAAIALQGERRWIVTGTPIQNRIADLYSLVSFLGVEPLNEKDFWNRIIQRPLNIRSSEGISRLRALMSAIALRRTKQTQVDGNALVDLPPKRVVIELVEFSKEERELYTQWETEGQKIIANLVDNGTLLENYSSLLTIILRLRQICDHAALCPKRKFGEELKGLEKTPVSPDLLEKLLSLLNAGGEDDCPICLSPLSLSPPIITRCAHLFCKNCIHKALLKKQACPLCRGTVKMEDLIEMPAEEGEEEGEGEKEVSPSSKVKALLESLLELQKTDPNVKSVVFSQFTSMLNMMQKPLEERGIKCVRLDGSMSAEKRERAMDSFKSTEPHSPTVFLVSLRAAGVGVNLTAASRVYILDPWWNPAVEEQAMDRVHRLGQTRPVEVIRFAVASSIEERILELQERKRELANSPFDKKSAKKMTLGDVKLLMRL